MSESPRPALGELARLATAVIETRQAYEAERTARESERDIFKPSAREAAANALLAFEDACTPEAVLQLVALATGGAEPEQQQTAGGSTGNDQTQEPNLKGEGSMCTDKAHRGLYAKFTVTRTDGSDAPGGKHEGCDYFTLDLTHDEFAAPALLAYADACRAKYPTLARDLRQEADAIRLRGCTGLFPSPGRGAV